MGRRGFPKQGARSALRPGLAGSVLRSAGDVVSSAPELARLSLNIAAAHHDSRVGGRRLVYGGHTIGLALGQASRLLPNLVTVLGWEFCDHTGPVHEDDTLSSELHIESSRADRSGRGAGATVAGLRGQRHGGRARPAGAGLAVRRPAVLQPGAKRRTQIVSLYRINNRPQHPRSVDISLSVGWQRVHGCRCVRSILHRT
jgi:acyl dehydratase